MTAKIIDGKAIAAEIREEIAEQIISNLKNNIPPPKLAVILVGEDPASQLYVKNKHLACQVVGINTIDYCLPITTTQQELIDLIFQLNQDSSVNGILVQLPLPPSINSGELLEKIHPWKDVDGFHSTNLGKLALNQAKLSPCTPRGVMVMLGKINQQFIGKHAVVVGASNIVGKPMAFELLTAGCTVTICHEYTKNLASHVRKADLLITAVGKPGVIKGKWIKLGATVIDIGITMMANGSMLGDVEFKIAKKYAKWITPVPGGVGPMTVVILLKNTVIAQQIQQVIL